MLASFPSFFSLSYTSITTNFQLLYTGDPICYGIPLLHPSLLLKMPVPACYTFVEATGGIRDIEHASRRIGLGFWWKDHRLDRAHEVFFLDKLVLHFLQLIILSSSSQHGYQSDYPYCKEGRRWGYLQFPQVFSTFSYSLQTPQKVPNSVPKLNKIAYNIYFVLIIVFDPEFACLQTLSEVVNLTWLWAFNALAFLGWGDGDCPS